MANDLQRVYLERSPASTPTSAAAPRAVADPFADFFDELSASPGPAKAKAPRAPAPPVVDPFAEGNPFADDNPDDNPFF